MTAMLTGTADTLTAGSSNTSDADLVAASRRGDREAFGRIVRRYQGMVTGLIYAGCGDLHRSEDLAQETFISAWKSLSGLREPAKLPAWLCQVARHRLLDNARSESRNDARLARAFHEHAEATAPSPEEQVLSEEERELLWRTLREIPQPYRETMVLYYRQGKSVGDVALATDTTEANVRQRLSRGREMLREQVAAMLERNLVRTSPGPAFAVAVVAALPVLLPQTAAAAATGTTVAITAKGAAATGAKGSVGLLALIAMWIGPIVGVLGGVFGTWVSIRNSARGRERRFIVRLAVVVWVFVTVSLATLFTLLWAHQHYHWSPRALMIIQTAFWASYGVLLTALIIVSNRRHRQIRIEEGLPEMSATPIGGRQFAIGLSFGTVGALLWMVAFAARANDTLGASVAAVATAVLAVTGFTRTRRRTPAQARGYILLHTAMLLAVTLVMVNWRFQGWVAAMNGIDPAQVRLRLPMWWMNGFLLLIYAVIFTVTLASLRRARAPQR